LKRLSKYSSGKEEYGHCAYRGIFRIQSIIYKGKDI
jgi:hypothetical protein